jgi:hypothetical protein
VAPSSARRTVPSTTPSSPRRPGPPLPPVRRVLVRGRHGDRVRRQIRPLTLSPLPDLDPDNDDDEDGGRADGHAQSCVAASAAFFSIFVSHTNGRTPPASFRGPWFLFSYVLLCNFLSLWVQ